MTCIKGWLRDNPSWKLFFTIIICITIFTVAVKIDPLHKINRLSDLAKQTGGITSMTTLDVNSLTPNSFLTYSFIFLLVTGPITLIALLSYSHFRKRTKYNEVKDMQTIRFNTLDNELYHFPDQKLKHADIINNTNLDQYVKMKLMHGKSLSEMQNELVLNGWPKDKINVAFKNLKLTKNEAEIVLNSFIVRSLTDGHEINSVRHALITKGWNTDLVDETISNLVR